jgi:uncharacterized protein (TIGR03437 family)
MLAFLVGARAQVTLVATPAAINLTADDSTFNPSVNVTVTASDGSNQFVSFALSQGPFASGSLPEQATPVTFQVYCTCGYIADGVYRGTLTVTPVKNGSTITAALVIPVTLTVAISGTPVVDSILNAASFASGPLSPGEIISIFGANLGPPPGTKPPADEASTVIFFDGGLDEYFAPITYASDTQINCVVPYEVASWGQAYLQVGYVGGWYTTAAPNVQIVATAPAIFTATGTGIGQAAALNSDLTPNSTTNPALAGSTIAVYMTGEGQTSPPGVTGSVTCSAGCATVGQIPKPLLPVTALVGGQPATVSFYGEAPGLIAGVMQVNLVIPPSTPSGKASLSITVGPTAQAGVTVAVK